MAGPVQGSPVPSVPRGEQGATELSPARTRRCAWARSSLPDYSELGDWESSPKRPSCFQVWPRKVPGKARRLATVGWSGLFGDQVCLRPVLLLQCLRKARAAQRPPPATAGALRSGTGNSQQEGRRFPNLAEKGAPGCGTGPTALRGGSRSRP